MSFILFHVATSAARKAATEAGRDANRTVKATATTGLSLPEAKQILNIDDLENLEYVRKVTLVLSTHVISFSFRIMNICLRSMTNH